MTFRFPTVRGRNVVVAGRPLLSPLTSDPRPPLRSFDIEYRLEIRFTCRLPKMSAFGKEKGSSYLVLVSKLPFDLTVDTRTNSKSVRSLVTLDYLAIDYRSSSRY